MCSSILSLSGWSSHRQRHHLCNPPRAAVVRRAQEYGPHKTIYNRFVHWSRLGVLNKIFATLSARGGEPDQLMIDTTHLKAHRTAASLLKKRAKRAA